MTEPTIHLRIMEDAISVSNHAAVVKSREGRVVGFVETLRDQVQARVDMDDSGNIRTTIGGVAPQGEDDTLVAARILVAELNRRGAHWDAPVLAQDPADCESIDNTGSGRKLRMQVIRAICDPAFWQELAAAGSAGRSDVAAAFVSELEAAITRKVARYTEADRAELLLILDANRLPAFALTDVRDAAIARLRSLCAQSSFSAVWVIAPTPELTYELFPGIA